MPIKPLKEVLNETLLTLGKYQNGEVSQIKTNRPWLDHQNGITPKSFITIFGASFSGKSTELENMKMDIMDININPNASDYVWISNSFEMTNFATTLRDIKKLTKKQFKDILSQPFTDEEKAVLKRYKETKIDGRFFVNQIPLSAEEFLRETKEFLEQNKDKSLIVLDLDHAGLLRAKNDNKKLAVDDMVEGLNMLKNIYSNFVVNGKVSLYTENCIFVEVLKDRTADIGFTDLYTIEIKPFEKPKQNTAFTTTPNFSTTNLPTFDSTKPLPEVDFKDVKSVFD